MNNSMTRTVPQPRAGIIDDIEREDDRKGYEPKDFHRGIDDLPALLLGTATAALASTGGDPVIVTSLTDTERRVRQGGGPR
jgi:hypothetical protein